MKRNSIALIGFMATGKTSVGKRLAKILGDDYIFVETDRIVVEIAGISIPEIFSTRGEEVFRDLEIKACNKASKMKNVVISCGGGVVLNEINIENLKTNSTIILLKATAEEIYKRAMIEGKELRPIINKENPKQIIEKVLNERNQLYIDAAELIIDTTGKEIEEIVEEILKGIKI